MGVLPPVEEFPRISTGSAGLDDILGGGLDANRLYLYEGRPGTGKTTATAGRSMA
jgi:circadian clock protein KaiC